MPAPTPTIKSFLVADQVFRQETGKWCLIGVFDTIWAPKFPTILPSLGIYLKLADAEGDYRMRVEFHDSAGRCLSPLPTIQFQAQHRLAESDLGLQSSGLLIPAPGSYFFRLFFNEEASSADIPLGARQIGEVHS